MSKVFLYSLIIALLVVSCGGVHEKEMETVEKMQQSLEAVKGTYKRVDITKVNVANDTYKYNMNQISTYYSPDSIPKEMTNMVDFYKGIKKINKNFQKAYDNIEADIDQVDNQLKVLHSDLSKGGHSKENVAKFIENEQNNLDIVKSTCANLISNYETILMIHDSVAHKLNGILFENVE
jgi:hypothetical protein